ncbi:MAG TPA: hypothetical protein VES39_04020, partial [Rhodospirillales bacterium]|nr:hypothetical protein [Rhodospirillales bacterium]
ATSSPRTPADRTRRRFDVFFTSETYSIIYNDSRDLDFENGRIHGTYNRWVEYLKQDIALYVQAI